MDIEIDISDDRLFTDVALILDRDDFCAEIMRLRSVLKINFPPDNKASFAIPSRRWEKKVEAEIEKSRKSLYLPTVFTPVIEAVVFRNRVTKDYYSPAYLDFISNGTFDKEGATPDDTYIIVLSPGARDEDIIKAYQQYRDQLGNVKDASRYQYIHRVWDTDISKPEIRKHREWYKAFKSGKSFKNIAELETENCPIKYDHEIGKEKPKGCKCFHVSTIRKAINAYEACIWKTRTF